MPNLTDEELALTIAAVEATPNGHQFETLLGLRELAAIRELAKDTQGMVVAVREASRDAANIGFKPGSRQHCQIIAERIVHALTNGEEPGKGGAE